MTQERITEIRAAYRQVGINAATADVPEVRLVMSQVLPVFEALQNDTLDAIAAANAENERLKARVAELKGALDEMTVMRNNSAAAYIRANARIAALEESMAGWLKHIEAECDMDNIERERLERIAAECAAKSAGTVND